MRHSGSEQRRKKFQDQYALLRLAKAFNLMGSFEEPFDIYPRIVHLEIKWVNIYPSVPNL